MLRQEECSSEARPQSACLLQRPLQTAYRPGIGQVTIDVLPDEALLEIFDFYNGDLVYAILAMPLTWEWMRLAQVCRRWRNIIFGSPQRLDLRVVCTNTTPTRTSLGIWPRFPIAVRCEHMHSAVDEKGSSNIIAAFKHIGRISEVHIRDIDGSALEKLVAVMQEPFPILRHFHLSSSDESIPVVPETFLGGYTPRLRTFIIFGIPFLSLPQLIFSATRIKFLVFRDIPSSGYITPEVMANCLAALPNLEHLSIGFRSPQSRPIQINPPPLTRSVLRTLTRLNFHGTSEYLEDFVARIDAPLLNRLSVVLFMDLIFHIPRLHDFIYHTEGLMPCNQAYMEFTGSMIKTSILGSQARFDMEVRCERPDWQLSSMTQIFSQQLPLLSHIKQPKICEGFCPPHTGWKDDPDMDSSLWLELFHLFIAVRILYVSKILAPPVAVALQELGEGRAMEVLPMLQNLSLEGLQPAGPVQRAIQSFVASRQRSGHPIVIQNWQR